MKLVGILLLAIISSTSYCQQQDTLIQNLDSLQKEIIKSQNSKINNFKEEVYEGAKIDLKTYFLLLTDNLKQQVTQPFHTKKKDWIKVGAFAAVSGALALVNKPINRFAIKLYDDSKTVADVSNYVTNLGGAYEVYAIAGFYAYGLIFKTQKEKTTTVLATQAYITAGILSTAAKILFGAQRPYYTDPNTGKKGAIFRGPFYPFTSNVDAQSFSSFPSGHTTAAFAAATVYALEYKNKPLIPIISYSAATLIGLSRLTENKHWPTDVLAGAVLGYLSGRQVVSNFHRYSKLKRGIAWHKSVSYKLHYQHKQLVTQLVYSF